jgi:hypothetical protein
MTPVEIVPGFRGRGIKESDGRWRVNSSMMYLIYCKNPCKYHSVSPPGRKIKMTL